MNYAYIRFSTNKQDETQQMRALSEYAAQKGITIDAFEKDEGISGGVSYRERNLLGIVEKMKEGDVLIVSEISRLGRSMSDLNMLIANELRPRKVRLVVVKSGLDINCAKISAIDEMIFFALSFAAQIEKELIQQRTQLSMDDRKDRIIKDGGFFSKSGRWCTSLGRKKGSKFPGCGLAGGMAKTAKAEAWRDSSPLYSMFCDEYSHGTPLTKIHEKALRLYDKHPALYCTRMGKKPSLGLLSRWSKEISL